ncbi:MAG: DUF255 domain-containing protein [Bacteroidetes bacterium]|nr:MAG: DUF255 domain-containing protein [Bacteroidota bacterium]
MKKYLFFLYFGLLFIVANHFAYSQVLKPISWTSETSKSEIKQGQTIDLIFKAKLQESWYLYSTDFDPDLGPTVTVFTFKNNNSYQKVGKIKPINSKKKYDETWQGDITYFTKTAEFRQTIKVLSTDLKIEVSAEYQVCSEIDGKCVLLDESFVFDKIKVIPDENAKEEPKNQTQDTVKQELTENKTPDSISENKEIAKKTEEITQFSSDINEDDSLLGFLLTAFISGLFAIFTPCVFPMLPMTVSFFTSRSASRSEASFKGLMYGLSIVGIYTLFGFLVSVVFGADAANMIATNWVLNVIFFITFIAFALSFFGMYEIVAPSGLLNKVDTLSDKGGWLGIFFMALTLVLVSFSCTLPIVGSVLVMSANGEFLKPILGMLVFSATFALPFTLSAIFPSLLNNLPKSGGWLNSVKVVLGFVELALAFKFLSVADQVEHWGILDRHVYIAIWTAIAFCLGLYFLGKIRLPHDSPSEKIAVSSLLLAILTFSFALYLFTGMFGAPLKSLAGYLPPQSTNNFDLLAEIRKASLGNANEKANTENKAKYSDFLHLPHNLNGFFDYKEGLAYAKANKKPIFIDFTGHGCVNCREMESSVWADPEVLKRLKNDYVVIALYIDERLELPENEWVTTKEGKIKKTMGNINAEFQVSRFNNNAQPFYVLLDHNEQLLAKPKAYDLKVQNFVEFLDAGLMEFKKR